MGEEAVLDLLVSREAEKERREILNRSKSEADGIVRQAEEEARRARARNLPVYEGRGELARARLVHQAEFDAQVRFTTERQKIVDQFLEQVARKLQELSRQPGYRALLQGLLQEALAMAGGKVKVHCRPEDVGLVKDLLVQLGKKEFEVTGDEKGWGGVRLTSLDGTIALDNRLESRFAKAQEVYKEEIAKELFG